jgi:hypothetical protein
MASRSRIGFAVGDVGISVPTETLFAKVQPVSAEPTMLFGNRSRAPPRARS